MQDTRKEDPPIEHDLPACGRCQGTKKNHDFWQIARQGTAAAAGFQRIVVAQMKVNGDWSKWVSSKGKDEM